MFELLCFTLIGLIFGLLVTFGGYRLFLFLLPLWGFVFGFGLGAQTVQVIFGEGFLVSVTGWVVGFVVGAVFGLLSYLFYMFAVAILAGSFGYGLGVSIMTAIGINLGFLVWIVGIVLAVVTIAVVLLFNIQKYAIIVITALSGAASIIATLLAAGSGMDPERLTSNPAMTAIQDSFWWLIFFIVMGGLGIAFQLATNRVYVVETYNRLEA